MQWLLTIVCFTLWTSQLLAQPHSSEFWITVSDSDSPPTNATRYFGEYEGATYGVDGQINTTIIEQCGEPSFTFNAPWITIPSRAAHPWLCGSLVPYNFQGFPTNTLKCDTFNIEFDDGIRLQADFTFHWPSHDYLAARCDSMFFFYGYSVTDSNGNSKIVKIRIDMLKQDSAVIVRPQDITIYESKITNALIIKYGANMIDGVEASSPTAPLEFALYQNYPNPFNPTSRFSYALPAESYVTLKIYNVLGQEVRTVVNEIESAGYKSVPFDASALPSGIYFYRLQAGSFSDIKKMALIK